MFGSTACEKAMCVEKCRAVACFYCVLTIFSTMASVRILIALRT